MIILGPFLFGLSLILVSALGARRECSLLRRPLSMSIRAPWPLRLDAPPLPASVVGVAGGPIADGDKVFYDKGCEYCHTISGYGGIRGPDPSDAGDRMGSAQIATRTFSGAGNMSPYRGNLKPDELASLLAFLASRPRVQTIRWEDRDYVVPNESIKRGQIKLTNTNDNVIRDSNRMEVHNG
jgi:cytochrome c5